MRIPPFSHPRKSRPYHFTAPIASLTPHATPRTTNWGYSQLIYCRSCSADDTRPRWAAFAKGGQSRPLPVSEDKGCCCRRCPQLHGPKAGWSRAAGFAERSSEGAQRAGEVRRVVRAGMVQGGFRRQLLCVVLSRKLRTPCTRCVGVLNRLFRFRAHAVFTVFRFVWFMFFWLKNLFCWFFLTVIKVVL